MCSFAGLTSSGMLTHGPGFTLTDSMLAIGSAPAQALVPFPIGGARATGYAGLPQTGWWYDPTGRQVWQTAQAVLGADLSFTGTLIQYAGGAPFGATTTTTTTTTASGTPVGQVRLTFDGTERARITLPTGRSAALTRFRF